MATVNFCGFETGDATETTVALGTFSVQNSIAYTGTYALRVNPTTSGTGALWFHNYGTNGDASSPNIVTSYVQFRFRFATAPGSNSEEICSFANQSVAEKFQVRLTSAGLLAAYNGTTLLTTGSTTLSSGTWYLVEVKIGTHASAAPYEVRINGVSEFTGTFASSSNTLYARLGKSNNRNSQSVDFYYDDFFWDDAAYPGGLAVAALLPDANGNYQAWTIGAGAGSHYQNVDEVPNDGDTTYLLSPLVLNDLETEALTAGLTGTVVSVKSIGIFKQHTAGGTLRLVLRSGSTDDTTAANYTATSLYATLCKIYDTDPATSAAWVDTALASVETGGKTTSAVLQVRMTFTAAMVAYLPVTAITGSGSADFSFTASGGGRADIAGSGAASVSFAAAGGGAANIVGSGAASFAFTAAAVGAPDITGSGAGSFDFTATATSLADKVASGAAAFEFTASGDSKADKVASGAASFAFATTSGGRCDITGSGAAAFAFTAVGTSITTTTSSGTASFSFTASASSLVDASASGSASFSFTATASSSGLPSVSASLIQHLNYIADPQYEALPDYDPPEGVTGAPSPDGSGDGTVPGSTYDPTEEGRNPTARLVRTGGTGVQPARHRRTGGVGGIVFVQAAVNNFLGAMVGTGPYSVPFNSNVKANSLLLIFVAHQLPGAGATIGTTVTDTMGNTYHLIDAPVYDDSSVISTVGMSAWFTVTTGAGANTVTVNFDATPTDVVLTVLEYKKTKLYDSMTGEPLDGWGTGRHDSPGVTPPSLLMYTASVLVSSLNELVAAGFATEATGNVTFVPTGPFLDVIDNSTTYAYTHYFNTQFFVIQKLPASGDSVASGTATATAMRQWVGLGASFKKL